MLEQNAQGCMPGDLMHSMGRSAEKLGHDCCLRAVCSGNYVTRTRVCHATSTSCRLGYLSASSRLAATDGMRVLQGAFWDGGPRTGLERESAAPHPLDRTSREPATAATSQKQEAPFPMVPLLKVCSSQAYAADELQATSCCVAELPCNALMMALIVSQNKAHNICYH